MSRRRRSYRGRRAPFKFRKGYNRTSGYYRSNAKAVTELKFIDGTADSEVLAATTIPNNAGIPISFGTTGGAEANATWGSPIVQDTGESDRIGRKILIKSVHVRGQIVLSSASSEIDSYDTVRIMFVLDKQCNGTNFTLNDVLAETGVRDTVFSFKLLANKKRFAVLKDFSLSLHTAAHDNVNLLGYENARTFECHLTNLNIPMEYNSTTGAIDEVASNHLMCFFVSENNACTMRAQFRLRFIG